MGPCPLALLLAALLLAACGGGDEGSRDTAAKRTPPALGGPAQDQEGGDEPRTTPTATPAAALSFPALATKNTTRVDGADPIRTAAGVALAVFPSRSAATRPSAVSLVDASDWRAAVSAAQLMSRPLRAPVLLSEDGEVPAATQAALERLRPTGARRAGRAALLRVGRAPDVDGLRGRVLPGIGYAEQARQIDRLHTAASGGRPTPAVLVAPAGRPDLAMAAAGYAAKTGTPVLWSRGKQVPAATVAAIRTRSRPRIYLLGPESAIPAMVERRLARLGPVRRVPGRSGVALSVAFARYRNAGFGWNATDPGHGFVFASMTQPAVAAAAAPLSASGTYGPLLLLSDGTRLDREVEGYLLDVQPGYDSDPVRGVYNHGWVMGDASAISVDVQARIDALLEIQPVDPEASP